MLLIKPDSSNPYFNFAAEEYFMKNFDEEFFLTSFYDPSISIGINQNTLAEINALYVKQNKIKVVRRNSGGGSVFHDKGCVNYSFIVKDDGLPIDSFEKYCDPIINFLREKFGLKAHFQSRNNIFLEGKKISRMAKFKYNGKIVQHGAILYSSNLKSLKGALKNKTGLDVDKLNTEDLPVANLVDFLDDNISAAKFKEMLYAYIKSTYPGAKPYVISKEDTENIRKIADDKFVTWDWNYGKSPDYDFKKEIKCPSGKIEVLMKVESGFIKDINIYGNFFSEYNIKELEGLLINQKHKCDVLLSALGGIDIKKYFGKISNEQFINSLF